MKKEQKLGFADYLVGRRLIKQDFFNQVNLIVDWWPISNLINQYYQKGESVTGAPSYD
jgi:IS5 family transposase